MRQRSWCAAGDCSWWGNLGIGSASRWSRSHFSGGCRVRPIADDYRPCCSSLQISIDFTKSLSFESAPVSILGQSLDPSRSPAPQDGPVSITAEFNVDPTRRNECIELMRDARMIFLRNGANRWHLYEDLNQPNKFRMEVVVPSWKQHLLQRERMTKNEKEVLLKLRSLRTDPNPPEEWISLSVEKEVLNRRVRTGDSSGAWRAR